MKTNENIIYDEALLTAYIAGELELSTEQKVLKWIQENEENQAFYDSIVKTWELSGKITPIPVVVDTDIAWNSVRNSIKNNDENIIPINAVSNRRIYLSVAAMVIVIVGVFSIMKFAVGGSETIERIASNSVLVDQLSDGTSISLNENSSIVYLEGFTDNERRVTLDGEAFFDVARDETKPFIVDLPNETYVKVLGTSFNIKAIDGDSLVSVYVKTGRVEFGSESNNIILTAGEKGVYNKNTDDVTLLINPATNVVETYWLDGEINFDETPLDDVIKALNQIFPNSRIILNCDTNKKSPTVSSHRKGESIDEILDVISSMHGLRLNSTVVNKKTIYEINCNDQ